ncbi:MAG: heparinase II/III family protein, partial [Candidatus Eisenbacteria bacterium]|nr:heparinase II/III family protein [Candidatus Eisenbacteria bacterium]
VSASHDGYLGLRDPVRHRRAVVFVKPATLVVVDLLSGKGWHEYEQNFHLGGPATLLADEGCVEVRAGEDDAGSLLFTSAASAGGASLVEGQTEPIRGWNSPRFWEKAPSPCLSVKGRFKGTVLLETCVVAGTGRDKRPQVSFPAAGREARLFSVVKTRTEALEETSLVNLGTGEAGDESLQSDASYACVREFPDGGLELFGRNVGRLVRRGEVLLEATARMPFVRARLERNALRYEARGEGTVSVRSGDTDSVVSSMPGITWEKNGEFVRILADT